VAREKGIAAFIVMHDATLEELCVRQPRTLRELRGISGMGEKKCEMYGAEILRAFERFRNGERASKEWHARASNPSLETRELLQKGHTLEEIAQIRGRKVSSVVALVADLIERGETDLQESWVDAEKRQQIRQACERVGLEWMKPIKEVVPETVTYDEIRLVLAEVRRERGLAGNSGAARRAAASSP
jgi:ATP-dependent DNA helicase RecQ